MNSAVPSVSERNDPEYCRLAITSCLVVQFRLYSTSGINGLMPVYQVIMGTRVP